MAGRHAHHVAGCGKTSLLNALAARLPVGGQVTGEILINGQPRRDSFRNYTAYVMQDDVLFSGLTVRETFNLAATLRVPKDAADKDARHRIVDGIIQELGLLKAADTKVGGPTVRGVSGGERKRVNIGVQMISNPSIMFLDEPTSGLDAFQAQSVMELLTQLAGNGRTLVAVIHQPRSSVYDLVHNLLLLSEGKVMYFGRAREASALFAQIGFVCPASFSPADFFLDVVSMDYRSPQLEQASRQRIELIAEKFDALKTAGEAPISMRDPDILADDDRALVDASKYATPWMTQFFILFWRAATQIRRDFVPLGINIFQSIFLGLLLGLVFRDIPNTQQGVFDTQGIIIFACIDTGFTQVGGVITTFPMEKPIIQRERASKAYHISAYFVSKVLAEMPIRLSASVLYISILYWLTGLRPSAEKYGIFIGVLLLAALAAQGLAFCTSAIAKDQQIALATTPMLILLLMMFSGFFITLDSLPAGAKWVSYISMIRWAYQATAINQFRGQEFVCDLPDQEACVPDGEQVLARLGFKDRSITESVWALCILIVGWYTLAYVGLRVAGRERYLPIAASKDKGT